MYLVYHNPLTGATMSKMAVIDALHSITTGTTDPTGWFDPQSMCAFLKQVLEHKTPERDEWDRLFFQVVQETIRAFESRCSSAHEGPETVA